MAPEEDITVLLAKWRDGDKSAEARLFELALPELRRIARGCMARERQGHPLQATELIGLVYERLVRAKESGWENREHFYAIVRRMMMQRLIDEARALIQEQKVMAGAAQGQPAAQKPEESAVMVECLLAKLDEEHSDWRRAIELTSILGMTNPEAARELGIPLRTLERAVHEGRYWLFERITAGSAIARKR